MIVTIKLNAKNNSCLLALLLLAIAELFFSSACIAQNCPPNIDFETGTFDGWTCYTGFTKAVGDKNIIDLTDQSGPVLNHHTMYTAGPGQLDPFGLFPVNCPNGSLHSIKLGSTEAGAKAEGISYDFTIPADQNLFLLTFYYAVVIQAPIHKTNEQPRMEIEVKDVANDSVIKCASFAFTAIGTTLPGFEASSRTDTVDVLFKNWSPITVDLSGNAGKTIRLFFKTADCTFSEHFGYAYIDVSSDCSASFKAPVYCSDDTTVTLTAPYGYAAYTWFDSAQTTVLGNQQVLTLAPPPLSGTVLAVKLDPYDGFGCKNVLFARLKNTLALTAEAGLDRLSCNLKTVQLGASPKQGLSYSWSPATGLSNPGIANPLADPSSTTAYILTVKNSGGGCTTNDTVVVQSSMIDTSLEVTGRAGLCLQPGESLLLKTQPIQTVQWFKDQTPINGANGTTYQVTDAGLYQAMLTNAQGCSVLTEQKNIQIKKLLKGIIYPDAYAIDNLPFQLHARKIGVSVLWQPATSLNNPFSFDPIYKGRKSQLYTVENLTIDGCIITDTQLVKTVKAVEIYVPTAFTPNGDGNNDLLRPVLRGIQTINYFKIFNRFGQLIFESAANKSSWDGTFNGEQLRTQSVVWLLQCIGADGLLYNKKGSTLLLK